MAIPVRWDVDELQTAEAMLDGQQWADALCRQIDPDLFYPEKGGSSSEAKKICRTCPIQEHCLEWALARDERFGIWGGLSERERRALKRQLNASDSPDDQCPDVDPTGGRLADPQPLHELAIRPVPVIDESRRADARVSCADARALACDHPNEDAPNRRGTDRHGMLPPQQVQASARPGPQGRLAG